MGEETTLQHDELEFKAGMALLKAGRLDEAVEKFHAAATTGLDRPMEHYALAAALYKSHKWERAKKEFETFLRMSPEENRYGRQAKSALPIIEERLREHDEVTLVGLDAPTLHASASYDRGVNAYLRGDFEEAEACFLETMKELPDNQQVHNNLGLTYLAVRKYPESVAQFELALAIDSDFVEARNNLGLAWVDYGANQARTAWEVVLAKSPDFFDTLVNLGALYYRWGDIPKAREMWRRARKINPDDAQVRRNLQVL